LNRPAPLHDFVAISADDVVVSIAPLAASIGTLARSTQSDATGPFWQHPSWWQLADQHLFDQSLELITVSDAKHNVIAAFPVRRFGGQLYAPQHDHLTVGDAKWCAVQSADCLEEVMDSVLTHLDAWAWEIGNAPDISILKFCKDNDQWHWRETRQSAWFDTSGSLEIPGKLRRNLLRHQRHLEEDGELIFSVVDGSDVDIRLAAINDFLNLEASGWKGESGTAINADPGLTSFYKGMNDFAANDLSLEIHRLEYSGELIASQVAIRCADQLYLLKIAYDEAFASRSPGALLLLETLNHCVDGDTQTLSLVSAPEWAKRWHPKSFPVWHATRFSNTTQGLLRQKANRLKHGFTQQLRDTRNRMRS